MHGVATGLLASGWIRPARGAEEDPSDAPEPTTEVAPSEVPAQPTEAAPSSDASPAGSPADPALTSQWQSTLILHAYGCLSSARLAEALALAHETPPPSEVTVHVIERVGNSVQIRLIRDHRELGQRDLLIVGETCPAVVEAAALLVTESLATLPAQPVVARGVVEPAPHLPEATPTETERAPAPSPSVRSDRWMAIGGFGWGMMYSTRFTPQVELLVGRHFGLPHSWGAELRFGPLLGWGRINQGMPDGAHIAVQSWSGVALGCARFPKVLALCLGATVGAIRAQGRGFDENFSSDTPWWTVVGQLESHVPLHAHWALHWTVRGQYSPNSPAFVLEQADGTSASLEEVPLWGLQLQAGARYWF